MFDIAENYFNNSFFNDSIERVLRNITPPLRLTSKIQELSNKIYDQLGLQFKSEVVMVTEDDEDVAFDIQLNMLFEDLISQPTQKMSAALEEIMMRRATHVYRQ